MRLSLCSVLIFSLLESVHPWVSDSLKLNIPNLGGLIGRFKESHSGKGIKTFLGVPFAEPPVGDLRFRAPVPKRPWQSVLDATKGLKQCTQPNWDITSDVASIGVENCLYLNIYVPLKYKTDGIENFPVMLWYHGGGWQAGFNEEYGPDYILDHDVILVTANYRLGALGFLSTGQEDCPGNNGFKDQVLALKWVKENIQYFGGDSEKITVFGESAGGATVTYLMMSPLAKDLFIRGIAQSGTLLSQWALPLYPGEAEKNAAKLGDIFNCTNTGNDWKGMLNCLRTVSANDIIKSMDQFLQSGKDLVSVFGPVVEYEHDGAFLTKHPRAEKHAWGNSIDLLTGINLNEGLFKSVPIFTNKSLLNELTLDFNNLLPMLLFYENLDDSKKQELTNELSQYYFGGKFDEPKFDELTNLFTDSWILSGLNEYLYSRFVDGRCNKHAKTFVYLFAHKGESSITEVIGGGTNHYGVCHADELQYLFPFLKEFFVSAVPSIESIAIRKAMTKMWVEFATTGHSSCESDSEESVPEWRPTKSFPLDYLRIGIAGSNNTELFGLDNGLFNERSVFWRNLISKYFPNAYGRE